MIAVKDIAYIRVPTPDLDAMEQCLIDFGLHRALRTEDRLYMRGSGTQPFVHVAERAPYPGPQAIGMLAQSLDDLHRLAAETGMPVENNTEPGGGHIVRLIDPAGLHVEVVFGQTPVVSKERRPSHAPNFASRRDRRNLTQRFEPKPSHVMRLGHIVARVHNFREAHDWYANTLGLKISDSFYEGDESNVIMAFMHCGLGQDYTDHHSVALLQLPPMVPTGIDHAAYEVLDLDDLMIGHEYLKRQGHVHSWGIGRHVEGSQIFDYWRDPNGMKIEHWTDGDAVNDDYPVTNKPVTGVDADPGDVSPWGPVMTIEFTR